MQTQEADKGRIRLTDNSSAAIALMADANYGAWLRMAKIITQGPIIDPDTQNSLEPIKALDEMGIYGKAIFILFEDICYGDLPKTLAVIKAVHVGLLDKDVLKDACSKEDCSGRNLVPVFKLYDQVKQQFPNFHNK